MKELFKEMAQCKNEIRSLKSIVSDYFQTIKSLVILLSSRFYQKIVLSVDQLQQVNLIDYFFFSGSIFFADSPGFRSTENNSKWVRGGAGNRSTNTGHMSDDGGVSTPLRYTKTTTTGIRKPQQVQSSFVQRSISSTLTNKNVLTPLRTKTTSTMSSVAAKYATPMRTTLSTNKKVALKNIKSSGYGQFNAINNTTTTIKKQQQQQLNTLATPGRSFRK